VCIDHHYSNTGLSDVNIVDDSASASGEIVYGLINRFGFEIDYQMALDIYVAILADTGSFRFSSTTPNSHYICAELLKKGIKPREIFGYVYESYSWERMILFSKCLTTVKKVANGKAISVHITREMMESSQAKREDIDGFVEYIGTIKGVEIATLFLELADNKVKVSLRSKDVYDVNKIAAIFGGGGHKNAAGIVMKDYDLQKAEDEVLSEINKLFT
jgi:phosphoesterase RecJ-like protein